MEDGFGHQRIFIVPQLKEEKNEKDNSTYFGFITTNGLE